MSSVGYHRGRAIVGRSADAGDKYIQSVQELIETPVALVSTSPEREDTILVRDPFMD